MTTCYQSYSKAVSIIHWHIFNVVTYWHHISEVPSMCRHMLFFIFHSSKIFTTFPFSISDKIIFFHSLHKKCSICSAMPSTFFSFFPFFFSSTSFIYFLIPTYVMLCDTYQNRPPNFICLTLMSMLDSFPCWKPIGIATIEICRLHVDKSPTQLREKD